MAKVKCTNKDCSKHEVVIEIERCRWIWDSKLKTLVMEKQHKVCPECGEDREELPKDWEGWNTSFRNPEKTYSKDSKGTIY